MGAAPGAVAARCLHPILVPMNKLSREVPIDPAYAALLIIDIQNYCIAASSYRRISTMS